MASTYLTRTPASAGNRKTFTISFWVKRCKFGSNNYLMATSTGTSEALLVFFNGDKFDVRNLTAGSGGFGLTTNRLFRDPSAWYHFLVAVDTTQATSSNRVKIYVNGTQETSLLTSNYPAQNEDLNINSTILHTISGGSGTSNYLDGILTHYHFIDGTAYDASAFGETDATTGIWKPITEPSVTYGTNGFFLKFENSGSMGTDSSPNGNNLTVNGTLTQTVDTPSNVFAVMNSLQYSPSTAFSNGNLTVQQNVGTTAHRRFTATLGASSGKYYWEVKPISGITSGCTIGIVDGIDGIYSSFLGEKINEWGYNLSGDIYHNDSAYQSGLPTYTNGDIINIALDLDNNYIYFGKNGTWINSGVPTSGATGTGGYAITDNIIYHPGISLYINTATASFNFGNGYFGTTAVSSATSDESGLGIFEYTVPSGYYALCTKNINEQEYD